MAMLPLSPMTASDDELLACALGGSGNATVLAAKVTRLPLYARRDPALLVREHGVRMADAARVAAVYELAERYYPDERPVVTTPGSALLLLAGLRNLPTEQVWAILLDARHRALDTVTVAQGTLNSARLLPADILGPALRASAAAVILAHNHPSGEASPSRADRLVTMTVRDGCRMLGVPLLDHLILTARSHFSFREAEGWEESGSGLTPRL